MRRLVEVSFEVSDDGIAAIRSADAWLFLDDQWRMFSGERFKKNWYEVCDWCEHQFGDSALQSSVDADGDPIPGPMYLDTKGIWAVYCGDFFFREDRYATLFKIRWG